MIDWVNIGLCGVVGFILGTADLSVKQWQTWAILVMFSYHPTLLELLK